jgi:hypothetical protein
VPHEFHPVANLFQLMEESALADLALDIATHGLREPIRVDAAGLIIDGRNRYLACQRAKVEPRFETFEDDPIAFAVSMNVKRRHMNEQQRAHVAAQIANMERGDPGCQRSDLGKPRSLSVNQAAKLLNVSPSTVSSAKTVLARGTPDEIEAMKAGEIGLDTLARDIRTGVPPEQRGKNRVRVRNTGHKMRLPAGQTIENLARRAIAMMDAGKSVEDVAAELGVERRPLVAAADIVRLADRDDLPAGERALAGAALADINANGQPRKSYEAVKHIATRLWGAPTKRQGRSSGASGRDGLEARRNEDFDRAFGMIVQVCLNAPRIELPHFSRDRATQIATELNKAAHSLKELRNRIMEVHSE